MLKNLKELLNNLKKDDKINKSQIKALECAITILEKLRGKKYYE